MNWGIKTKSKIARLCHACWCSRRELAAKRQNSATSAGASANIVETVVDLEDRLAKEFENFQFTPRETGRPFLSQCGSVNSRLLRSEDDKTNNLRSHHRKLDQNLLLLVKQKDGKSEKEEWIFPEKSYENEPSLRSVSSPFLSRMIVLDSPCCHLGSRASGFVVRKPACANLR